MKEKSKNIIFISIIGVLILSIYLGIKMNKDPNFIDNVRRYIRTDEYFVKIEQNGLIEKPKDRSPWIYRYETNAYNKKGDQIKVSFYANKNLEKNTYLCVYVEGSGERKDVYEIDSFEKITKDKLPKLAYEKLDKN